MNSKSLSYVESISDSEIHVVCRDEGTGRRIKSLGATRQILSPKKWRLPYVSEAELAAFLSVLRDAGVAMAGDLAGWPPAAVFEKLRDDGKLAGRFTEIVWANPGKEIVSEK